MEGILVRLSAEALCDAFFGAQLEVGSWELKELSRRKFRRFSPPPAFFAGSFWSPGVGAWQGRRGAWGFELGGSLKPLKPFTNLIDQL